MTLLRHTLDARLLEPPEPFRQAIAILRGMQAGEYLLMQHRRIPYPLFEFCDKQSLRHAVTEIEPQEYRIVMYFPVDESRLLEEGVL